MTQDEVTQSFRDREVAERRGFREGVGVCLYWMAVLLLLPMLSALR